MKASRARRSWRRLALGALASLLTLAVAPIVLAAPASAAPSSWEPKRTEEFGGTALPSGCQAYTGPYTGGKSAWSADDATVDKGLLNLKIEKRAVDGRNWSTGAMGCWNWAQKYGKYEIRAKIPQGQGIDSYFGLWPVKGSEGAWTGVELLAPGSETAYITNGYGTKAETARVAGDYSSTFHTYLIEWAPKYLRITMDGAELFFSTRSYSGERWPGVVVSNGDALTGVPGASTKLPATFQIDWIKSYTFTGVAPTLRTQSTAAKSRVAGTPTPVPAAAPTVPIKAPQASPSVSAATEVAAQEPALAGGIWPWLLGGSLIAVAAVALLNYPRHRANQRQIKQVQERERASAGRH